MNKFIIIVNVILMSALAYSQKVDVFKPTQNPPDSIQGYNLVWNEEFNVDGKPDSTSWNYEHGFKRNKELQWYQSDNAMCKNGVLIIEGRRQKVKNPNFNPESDNWKENRAFAEYTSASINTKGLHQWRYGRFEIRAKIDTSLGSWPAIWTLGIDGDWPHNGEIDLMEFYRPKGIPKILANVACGTEKRWSAKWDTERVPLSYFISKDADWHEKFHVWRMDWDNNSIKLYLDDELLNTSLLAEMKNPDGSSPFMQPHYILLNLAIGSNGGDPSKTVFPITYQVDYVRVYQKQFTSQF